LSGLGARLALWDIDADRCEETAREVRAKGGRAQSYICDIADRTQVLETAVKVRREVSFSKLITISYLKRINRDNRILKVCLQKYKTVILI